MVSEGAEAWLERNAPLGDQEVAGDERFRRVTYGKAGEGSRTDALEA